MEALKDHEIWILIGLGIMVLVQQVESISTRKRISDLEDYVNKDDGLDDDNALDDH